MRCTTEKALIKFYKRDVQNGWLESRKYWNSKILEVKKINDDAFYYVEKIGNEGEEQVKRKCAIFNLGKISTYDADENGYITYYNKYILFSDL